MLVRCQLTTAAATAPAHAPVALTQTLVIPNTAPAITIVGSQHLWTGNLRLVTTICTVYWRAMTVVITVSRKNYLFFRQ